MCPSFVGGYTLEVKNMQKRMKRNQLYAEMLKMGLSWNINTSNNPVAKTAKPKQDNPGSSSAMPLAEPHIPQLTH